MDLTPDAVIDLPGGWGRLRPCRHGLFMFNRNDRYIGQSLDKYGEFSSLETALLCSLVRPGDVFVDAGANIGAISIPLAQRVGPTGAGFSFEPQPLNFQILCANLALNGLTRVVPRNAGLSDADGGMTVLAYDPTKYDNYGDIRLHEGDDGQGEPVAVTTIDGLNLVHCRLIKIDVQGMEPRVLNGARATIARCRPALFVENDSRADSPALIRQIRDLGYRLWWHLGPMFNPGNFRGCAENIFPNVVSSNLLCLPAEGQLNIDAAEITDENEWPLGG